MGLFKKYNRLITDLEKNIKSVKGECGAIDSYLNEADRDLAKLINYIDSSEYTKAYKLHHSINKNINAAANSVRRTCNQPKEYELLGLLAEFEKSVSTQYPSTIKDQRVQIHLGFATLQTYVSKMDNKLADELTKIMAIIECGKNQSLKDEEKVKLVNRTVLLKGHISEAIGHTSQVGALQIIIALNKVESILKKEKDLPQFKA